MCVQNLDDSRGLAIRITYRISLRSSSLWEPRHPLLKVVCRWVGDWRYQSQNVCFVRRHSIFWFRFWGQFWLICKVCWIV